MRTLSAISVTTPAWVLDHLHTHGLPTRRGHGTITTHRRTRATPRWHPCGQPVWTGLCDREDVTLDPTPTTVDGELFAILTGRRTYQLTPFHYEIERRHPAHIRQADADQVRVYIAHACNGPHAIPNWKWEPKKEDNDENPPF
jgi:hypothetical protein